MSKTKMTADLIDIAKTEIATRSDLLATNQFPFDIWQSLGARGHLGLTIDPEFGGQGLTYPELSKVAEKFAGAAACPGLVMSWLGHNLLARLLIQEIGTEEQKQTWLPAMAKGDVTPAVAISEPGAGAHPKYLTSEAERIGEAYCLNGEKAFVTNGPIAGLFIVLAITGEANNRKQFSALLVPKSSSGITLLPMEPPIDFLHPSPHARINFENVIVPSHDILGPLGDGFDVVSKRVRIVEDIVGLGAMSGNLAAQLRLSAEAVTAAGNLSPDIEEAFGRLVELQGTLSTLAAVAATDLVSGQQSRATGATRTLQHIAQQETHTLLEPLNLDKNSHLALLSRDMTKSLSIASRAHKIQDQKRGAEFLKDQ